MSGSRTIKMTSATGLGVVLLFVVSSVILPLTDTPATDAPALAVVGFNTVHRSDLLVALYLSGLSFGLFLLFAGGLKNLLERAAGEECSVPAIGFGGAVAAATVLFVGFALFVASAYRVGEADPGLVRGLSDAGWATFAFSGFPTAVSIGAFSFVILRQRYLPAAIGWFGMLVAALHLVAAGSFAASSGGLSLQGDVAIDVPLGFYLWVLVVSVALARKTAPGERAPASGSAPYPGP
jgi:hypothetical protein